MDSLARRPSLHQSTSSLPPTDLLLSTNRSPFLLSSSLNRPPLFLHRPPSLHHDDDLADWKLSSPFTSAPALSPNHPSTYSSYQVESLNSNLFDYDASYGGGEDDSEEEERRAQAAPRVYDRYFDSSSDEESYPAPDGIETAGKRLDYMIQFLDRKLSSSIASTADGVGVGVIGVKGWMGVCRVAMVKSKDHNLMIK